MAMQVSAGSVTDAQFFDGGMAQSALLQILSSFRIAVQLQLVERDCLLQPDFVTIGAGWTDRSHIGDL